MTVKRLMIGTTLTELCLFLCMMYFRNAYLLIIIGGVLGLSVLLGAVCNDV